MVATQRPPEDQRRVLDLAQKVWLLQQHRGQPTKPNVIVVKVTRDCNLRCTYCYVSGGARKEHTSTGMVVDFFDQIAEGNPRVISCAFHGGEPLLAGELVREIVEALRGRPYGPRLRFSIQTNGTLVTDEWAQYFREHRFSVGVSLDGPRAVNDLTRFNVAGRGAFDGTMKGIDRLRRVGQPIGLICVVTKMNQDHLVDLLELCHEKDIRSVSFLPFFPMGYGIGKDAQLSADNLEYWEKTKAVITWLVEHNTRYPDAKIYEREIASMTRNIVIPGNGCYMCSSSPCGAGTQHVGLDVDGGVYVCDTFYGMADYVIGNVLEQRVDEILQSPLIQRFQRRTVRTIPRCSQCHLNQWCYGGCPAHNVVHYGERGFDREAHMCEWYMQIIPYLKDRFDRWLIDPQLLADLPTHLPIVPQAGLQ